MKQIQITFLLIFSLITYAYQTPLKNDEEEKKFIREYDKFMNAYCANTDINDEVLKKLDACDEIVFSKEGKQMEHECMVESAPKGANANDRRRLWCNDITFYEKTKDCYLRKLEAKQKRDGHAGEQISEEQLKNDTIRAMECRKRVFKF